MAPNLPVLLMFLLFVGKLLTANGQLQDISEDIGRVLELAEEIDDNVEDVEDGVNEVRSEIEDIEDKLDELGMEVESMGTNVDTVKTEVLTSREEVKTTRSVLNSGIMRIEREMASEFNMLAEVRELQTHTQSLKNDTQCIKEGFSSMINTDVDWRANLESKLASLEAELKENTLVNTDKYLQVEKELARLREDVNSTLYILQQMHQNDIARLCSELHPTSPSGYYWLTGVSERVYCDMDRQSCGCGRPKGWMRVAHIDMTDPNQQCPEGFELRAESGIRMCEVPPHRTVCVSITFPTHGVQYSRVCGKVKAYQYATTDAFYPYYQNESLTIDDIYLDGVSVTHGTNPRKHIWTFAAGLGEEGGGVNAICPCHTSFTGLVPSFIRNDYFCDTGSHSIDRWPEDILYSENPLWDGEGCGPTSLCCKFNSPPWFCKELPLPTTDDIEVRVCSHMVRVHEESTPFELIDIAVQ